MTADGNERTLKIRQAGVPPLNECLPDRTLFKMKEMKTQHTPAPWKITYSPDGKEALINRGHVASVELDDNEQGEANTKLIAAAPELLEACESIMGQLDSGNLVRDTSKDHHEDWAVKQLPLYQTLSRLATAIEKAKGKSQ